MYEYSYKLIDSYCGTIKSETSLGKPQIFNAIEKKHGRGMIKSIEGMDVSDTPDASQHTPEQKFSGPLTSQEIEESWARAYAKVPQS